MCYFHILWTSTFWIVWDVSHCDEERQNYQIYWYHQCQHPNQKLPWKLRRNKLRHTEKQRSRQPGQQVDNCEDEQFDSNWTFLDPWCCYPFVFFSNLFADSVAQNWCWNTRCQVKNWGEKSKNSAWNTWFRDSWKKAEITRYAEVETDKSCCWHNNSNGNQGDKFCQQNRLHKFGSPEFAVQGVVHQRMCWEIEQGNGQESRQHGEAKDHRHNQTKGVLKPGISEERIIVPKHFIHCCQSQNCNSEKQVGPKNVQTQRSVCFLHRHKSRVELKWAQLLKNKGTEIDNINNCAQQSRNPSSHSQRFLKQGCA